MGKSKKVIEPHYSFDDRFMSEYAGQIIEDSRIAIVEMVANAYDAGATVVKVIWPLGISELLEVTDNGTGMSRDELEHRWRKFSYNRTVEQGSKVEFPPGVRRSPRTAFGQSGKGRFAPLCFCDSYRITTIKKGVRTEANVEKIDNGSRPFSLTVTSETKSDGCGTTISLVTTQNPMAEAEVVELLWWKVSGRPIICH